MAGAVSCLCALVLVMGLSLTAIRHGMIKWHFGDLLDYQISKLRGQEPIDILLVGDSSLGNGVDARAWSSSLGKNTVSLALTGVYGLDGSLSMLRRAARQHSPRTVIIMHTADIMNRQRQSAGNLFIAERLGDYLDLRPLEVIGVLANWDIITRIKLRPPASNDEEIAALRTIDYVPQSTPLSAKRASPPQQGPTMAARPNENIRLIRDISEECRLMKSSCYFMYGPILDTFCKNSAEYFAQISDLIEGAGLPVIRSRVCLPWQDVGDAIDHVLPAKKGFYSDEILESVRPYIRE